MAGVKRSTHYILTCSKPAIVGSPGVSGRAMVDRTVSSELEIGSDGGGNSLLLGTYSCI
jgi:hypothetical protein